MKQTDIAADLIKINHPCYNFDDQSVYFIQSLKFNFVFCYFFRLVELDPNAQEVVSKMSQLIDKLVFMIDRRQSMQAGYSLFSSQVAANTLFYCTFNVKSATTLVDCGALDKIIDITTNLLDEMHGDTPLR